MFNNDTQHDICELVTPPTVNASDIGALEAERRAMVQASLTPQAAVANAQTVVQAAAKAIEKEAKLRERLAQLARNGDILGSGMCGRAGDPCKGCGRG